jgi:hypothetical protein
MSYFKTIKKSDPITSLKLRVRTELALRNANMAAVGNLLSSSPEYISKLRNIGAKSLSEIARKMATWLEEHGKSNTVAYKRWNLVPLIPRLTANRLVRERAVLMLNDVRSDYGYLVDLPCENFKDGVEGKKITVAQYVARIDTLQQLLKK